jgi:TPR repeat protein
MKQILALVLIFASLLDTGILFAAEDFEELRAKAEVLVTAKYLAELRAKADNGDAEAQVDLGLNYFLGLGLAKDPNEALKWFRKAADQGNANAQGLIGAMYAQGVTVPKDLAVAAKWFRMAADQGLALAQYFLGDNYAKGEGVVKDPTEAAKWYRKSAEQGVPSAQRALALMYYTGEGVVKNAPAAVKWYRKAADQGDADAQCSLGMMYAIGEGVLKDEIEALAWFNLSAASGDRTAVYIRANLEHRLGQQATLVAQQRSKDIFKRIEVNKAAHSGAVFSPMMIADNPKSSGSGTIVASSGYVLTAAHVVAGSANIKIITAHGTKTATVARLDEANDLAVLKIDGGAYAILPVSPSSRVRLGQSVATIGFPNIGIQGFSPKLTRGEISSVNGIGDDPRGWQISVPVQPGNSGGPLLDENGNLIGVIVAKLSLRAAKVTGDLPQNVNYAVKSAYALALLEPYLDSSPPETNQTTIKRSFEDMVAKAQQSVVLILVY